MGIWIYMLHTLRVLALRTQQTCVQTLYLFLMLVDRTSARARVLVSMRQKKSGRTAGTYSRLLGCFSSSDCVCVVCLPKALQNTLKTQKTIFLVVLRFAVAARAPERLPQMSTHAFERRRAGVHACVKHCACVLHCTRFGQASLTCPGLCRHGCFP